MMNDNIMYNILSYRIILKHPIYHIVPYYSNNTNTQNQSINHLDMPSPVPTLLGCNAIKFAHMSFTALL